MINIPITKNFEKKSFIKICDYSSPKPFIKLSTEKETIKLFFDAVKEGSEINKYMSKLSLINSETLEKIYSSKISYKLVNNIYNSKSLNNKIIKNSVLIINEKTLNTLLHLYLIKEPDKYSIWKILLITND